MIVSTECTSCGAVLKLKNESFLGRDLNCPKCGASFVAEAIDNDFGNAEFENNLADEWEESAGSRTRRSRPTPAKNSSVMGIMVIVIALVAVCGGVFFYMNAQEANRQELANQMEAPRTKVVGKPITDDEIRVFVGRISNAMATSDTNGLTRILNLDAIVDKSMAGIDAPLALKNGFRQGVRQGMRQNGLGQQLVANVKNGGSYTYLKTVREGDLVQLIFRLVDVEGALNYHRFDLTRDRLGDVVSGDIYIFLTGEYLSTTLRRAYIPAVASQQRNILSSMNREDRDLIDASHVLPQIQTAQQLQNHREVIRLTDGLPQSVKKMKFIAFMRLLAAQQVDDATYLRVLDEIQKNFPNDPGMDLMVVDYYVIKKDYKSAMDAINRLDKALGSDLHLESLRAGLQIQAGNFEEAMQHINALDKDSDIYYRELKQTTLLDWAVAKKDHAKTKEALLKLENDFFYKFGDLRQVPDFADFVTSPQYQQWQNER